MKPVSVRPPVLRPIVKPVQFTPFQGLMSIAQRLTGVLEKRSGLDLWSGDDGVSAVAAELFRGLGVPERPICLGTAERPVSPRIVAEKCGLLKRRAARRRVKR